jgi:hypothetical protein
MKVPRFHEPPALQAVHQRGKIVELKPKLKVSFLLLGTKCFRSRTPVMVAFHVCSSER